MSVKNRTRWYVGGLHFECTQCGNCCAGPGEGFVWLVRKEIEMIAEHLGMTPGAFRDKYVRRIFNRTSLVEDPATKDCVFLTRRPDGSRGCSIYPVRPNQCRTWPFWTSNLRTPDDWNEAGVRCEGINRGRQYSFDEIEQRRKQHKWWPDE